MNVTNRDSPLQNTMAPPAVPTRHGLAARLSLAASDVDALAALGRHDRIALGARVSELLKSWKLGVRKEIELALRSLPPQLYVNATLLTLSQEPTPLPLRIAMVKAAPKVVGWLDPGGHTLLSSSLLVDSEDDRLRAAHAAALIPGGALLERSNLTIRVSGRIVGFAEVLLVRAPPPAAVNVSPCRVCWGEEDGEDLDPTVAEAAATATITGAASPHATDLPLGILLHDVCGCRGSASSVHEGCLATFLLMTTDRSVGMTLTELKCVTCHQPFVGRASALLSRCAAAVRAARAKLDEEEAAAAALAAENDVAGAAELAEEAALAAAEGRANEATALWKAGQFDLSMRTFLELIDTLREMKPPTDGMRYVRKALLQHSTGKPPCAGGSLCLCILAHPPALACSHDSSASCTTEHNVGLIMITNLQRSTKSPEERQGVREVAQPMVASALAGLEGLFGTEHPKVLHVQHTMGLLAAEADSHEEAAACFRTAWLGRSRALGPDHHETLRSANDYGRSLVELKRFSEALAHIDDIEGRVSLVLGGESPMALISQHVRALCLAGTGKRSEAISVLRKVHGSRVTVVGAKHYDTLSAASDLGDLLGKVRRPVPPPAPAHLTCAVV